MVTFVSVDTIVHRPQVHRGHVHQELSTIQQVLRVRTIVICVHQELIVERMDLFNQQGYVLKDFTVLQGLIVAHQSVVLMVMSVLLDIFALKAQHYHVAVLMGRT